MSTRGKSPFLFGDGEDEQTPTTAAATVPVRAQGSSSSATSADRANIKSVDRPPKTHAFVSHDPVQSLAESIGAISVEEDSPSPKAVQLPVRKKQGQDAPEEPKSVPKQEPLPPNKFTLAERPKTGEVPARSEIPEERQQAPARNINKNEKQTKSAHQIIDGRKPGYSRPAMASPTSSVQVVIMRRASNADCNRINVNDPTLIALVNKLQDVFSTVGVCLMPPPASVQGQSTLLT